VLLLVLAFHGALAAAQPAPVRRGITAEDYALFETSADVAVSSDGTLVAYSVVAVDEKQNRRASTIWLVATDGRSAPRPFTAPPYSASQPRWSPDGRTLAFVSARPTTADPAERSAPQVFLAAMTGGEPRRLTSLKNGVTSFSWSSDGSRLVCVGRIGPSDVSPERKSPSDVRHYTPSSYKFNGIGWFDDRRSHLWVVNVQNGATKQLTDGEFDESDPQWSPDGRTIAYIGSISERNNLHSDSDHRVPLEQGEQWFRALEHVGVTTEFVIFPRENHDLTRTGEPKHLVESLNWQVYWFDRFLNGNTKAVPPDEARSSGAPATSPGVR
jgi:dipeptidyl aminopeptidase/acylaminoacyl peptidase